MLFFCLICIWALFIFAIVAVLTMRGLSTSSSAKIKTQKTLDQLAELQIPILDIYSIQTRKLGEGRKPLARQANYRLQYVSIAGRSYRGYESMLSRIIRNWLVKNYKI